MLRRLTPLVLAVALACTGDSGPTNASTWTLQETLRIGSGDEGPTSFSWVKGIDVDSAGRIFIYEHSTQDIRVFAPDGSYLKTIGRRGAGPGELGNAEGIAFARDGVLWVRDDANGRFTRFTADGEVLESVTSTFCMSQGTWLPRITATHFVDEDCVPAAGGTTYHVFGYRFDQGGRDSLGTRAACGSEGLLESATWITRTARSTSYRSIPYAPRPHYAVAPDATTWCVPISSTYEVQRIRGAADTLRVSRAVAPIPVSAVERDSIIADIDSRGPTGLDFSRIPQRKPAIDRITTDDSGRLWVRRANPSGGILFDLWSADGTLEATIELTGVQTGTWAPFVVRGDDVYLVILGEDDVPQVGRFRIARSR
jgi:hypothetical protein